MRRAAIIIIVALVVASVASAQERAPAAVVVTMQSKGRVRVQIAEGRTTPCDSSNNRMLFDGTLGPNETFQGLVDAECICIRNTSDAFPRSGWTPSGLACRPRICRGRKCWPAPDPTIRVTIDASSSS